MSLAHNLVNSRTAVPRIVLAIMAVAVLLRVAAALYHGPEIQPLPGVTDQISYHELAIRVADGHGFSFATGWWPSTRANQPTAHWSFLYVLFLAAIYTVTGPVPIVARIVQAVIVGVLHPWLAWRIGGRLFGSTVGIVTAVVAAVYGYFVYYSGALVTESLYIVAFLWVLDVATALGLALSQGRRPRLGTWVVLGLAFGAAALLRQVFVLMVPLIMAWLGWRYLKARREEPVAAGPVLATAGRMAVALVVLGLCILPWTVRNYRAFGQFVLLNTNAGFVMYWGNHPFHGTDFVPILPSDPTRTNYQTLLPDGIRGMNEGEMDRALLRMGMGFVADTPWRYVQLSIDRAAEYFKFWPTSDSSMASNAIRVVSFGLLAPLLLGGMVVAFGRLRADDPSGGAALLLLLAAAYSAVHLLTWTLVRYRLPVDGIMMPFAALCLVTLSRFVPSLAPAAPASGLSGSAN